MIKFTVGPGKFKYQALLPNGKKVNFGDKNYQQFHDKVPLGLYSHLDHNDPVRRKAYRARHSAQGYHLIKYSPSWFSYNYLW